MRISERIDPSVLLIAAFLIAAVPGCAPSNYSYPLRPLEKGETYTCVHVNLPFSDFALANLQVSVSQALDDETAVGVTLTDLVILSSIDVTHLVARGDADRYLLFSMNLWEYNPSFEIAFAASWKGDETSQAIKAGAGIYLGAFPWRDPKLSLIPVAEYVLRHRDARLAAGTRTGLTGATLTLVDSRRDRIRLEHSMDEIDTVTVDSTSTWEGYGIILEDGGMLNVRMRDPFVDCVACAIRSNKSNAYSASRDHRSYFVYYSGRETPMAWDSEVWMMQLDMERILARLETEGVLVIEEDPDILERTLRSHNMWIEDLYLDLGYVHQERSD